MKHALILRLRRWQRQIPPVLILVCLSHGAPPKFVRALVPPTARHLCLRWGEGDVRAELYLSVSNEYDPQTNMRDDGGNRR